MKKILSALAICLVLISSCGPSSYITSSWKTDNVITKTHKKIVVLGLIRDADRTTREKMEQHIAGDLKKLGYDAVCSCDEYNPKAFEGMSEQQALSKLRNTGVDAVLTVVLLDKTKEKLFVPGSGQYVPYGGYNTHFWGYYNGMQGRIYEPGYYVIDTKYFWESNFYNLERGELLYSAQSQSFDPSTTESLAHQYGQMIVKNMVKSQILGLQQKVQLKGM